MFSIVRFKVARFLAVWQPSSASHRRTGQADEEGATLGFPPQKRTAFLKAERRPIFSGSQATAGLLISWERRARPSRWIFEEFAKKPIQGFVVGSPLQQKGANSVE